jgi:lipoic acid synthetase
MTAAPDGRRMLRLEIRNTETPIERKPSWIRTIAHQGPEYLELQKLVKDEGLHTVCQEAGCPNIYECWEDREATFLIGGSQCTRRCDFCQIDTGKPADYDTDEPRRVADSVLSMRLRYATVTGVARDDLPDEGAWLHAETVRRIHAVNPGTGVEILATDFSGNPDLLAEVFSSRPEVFAHNVETVPRLFKRIRPAFRYERSLGVITSARKAGLITKSNLILGMGEERAEISQALQDLHDAGTDIITVTAPASGPLPAAAGVHRDQGGGRRHRIPRGARRPARALVVSGRAPVGPVHEAQGPRSARGARAPRRHGAGVRASRVSWLR